MNELNLTLEREGHRAPAPPALAGLVVVRLHQRSQDVLPAGRGTYVALAIAAVALLDARQTQLAPP